MSLARLRRLAWLGSRDGVLIASVVVSLVLCYQRALAALVTRWLEDDTYSHGFVVPFVSAYLLWDRRAALARTPLKPDPWGGAVLLTTGLLALAVGNVAGVVTLAEASLVVTLFGAVVLLLGRGMAWASVFPLLFLLFMIPVWDTVIAAAQSPSQRLSAEMGAGLMSVAGIPVRLDGVLLKLPRITLEVAPGCSGVNFAVAILALALPQACVLLRGTWLRIAVAGFAVVAALVTNGLRVGTIGALAYYNDWTGATDVHGPMHVLQSLSVAVVGIAVVSGAIFLLARRWPRPRGGEPSGATPNLERCVEGGVQPTLALLVCGILLSAATLQALPNGRAVEPARPLSAFPTRLAGPWLAAGVAPEPPIVVTRGTDLQLSRAYVGPSGRVAELHVSYFRRQAQGQEVAGERMLALERASRRLTLTLHDGRTRRVNEVFSDLSGAYYIVFWYEMNGRVVANGYAAKAWTVWDALTTWRTNAALVVVTSRMTAPTDAVAAVSDTRALARLAAAELDAVLPQ